MIADGLVAGNGSGGFMSELSFTGGSFGISKLDMHGHG